MAQVKTRATSTSNCPTSGCPLAVVEGRIVAGPHVRNAFRRHLEDLGGAHKRGLYFDREAADRKIAFFEEVLRLSEGQFEDKPFKLHLSQAFKIDSLFGWSRWTTLAAFRLRCALYRHRHRIGLMVQSNFIESEAFSRKGAGGRWQRLSAKRTAEFPYMFPWPCAPEWPRKKLWIFK